MKYVAAEQRFCQSRTNNKVTKNKRITLAGVESIALTIEIVDLHSLHTYWLQWIFLVLYCYSFWNLQNGVFFNSKFKLIVSRTSSIGGQLYNNLIVAHFYLILIGIKPFLNIHRQSILLRQRITLLWHPNSLL